MKNHSAFTIGILAALTALVCCQDMEYYCGRKLAEALTTACPNRLITRSGDQLSSAGDNQWAWIPKHVAKRLGRVKRQLINECCFKPCTMSEFVAYCAE